MATKRDKQKSDDDQQGELSHAERIELEDLRQRLKEAREAILSDAEQRSWDSAHAGETARDNAFEGEPEREKSDPDVPQELQPVKDEK